MIIVVVYNLLLVNRQINVLVKIKQILILCKRILMMSKNGILLMKIDNF
jgi:hypothetical protein